MTSATLFREGFDLDEVIAELESEHPGQIRVVDVAYGRDGGVLGFFARRTVGVRYRIEDVEDTLPGSPNPSGALPDPLEEMLRAAEAAEMIASGRAPQRPVAAQKNGESGGNVEFARMLLELAADKAAARRAAEQAAAPPISPVVPPAYQPTYQSAYQPMFQPPAAPSSDLDALLRSARTRPIGAHRADSPTPESALAPDSSAALAPAPPVPPTAPTTPATPRHHATHSAPSLDNHYALRRKLADLGVPFAWIPEHVDDPYRAVEQVIARLPEPRPIRLEPGQLLVVAGPIAEAEYTASRLCASLRLDAASTVHTVTQRWQAERLAARIRHERTAPAIVVVATDDLVDDEPADDGWAADIVAALTPDLVWLAVDAATKPADLRAAAAGLGRISAIAVSGTRRTTSPASVWELNTPVALLDGRRATRGSWTALLLDKLTDLGDLEL